MKKHWIAPLAILALVIFSLVLYPVVKRVPKTQTQGASAPHPAPQLETYQLGAYDEGAMRAAKTIEEKIAAAAPLAVEAVKVCTRASIPPSVITGIWGTESDYCEGEPIKRCGVSSAKAVGPTQHRKTAVPQSKKDKVEKKPVEYKYAFIKDGEDPEKLADAFKMTARHLCDAKRADKGHEGEEIADPGSNMAIMRYHGENSYENPSKYLNDVLANQSRHEAIFASLGVKKGPIIAAEPIPPGYVRTPRGNLFSATVKINYAYFPGTPLPEPATWFDSWGDQRDGKGGTKHGHKGVDMGCRYNGLPIQSICSGTVSEARVGNDGKAGKMVTVDCDSGTEKLWYMHLDSIAVQVGQIVAASQKIGGCGHTGNAEPEPGKKPAPHLHLRMDRKVSGNWAIVDPCMARADQIRTDCVRIMDDHTKLNPIRDVVIASN